MKTRSVFKQCIQATLLLLGALVFVNCAKNDGGGSSSTPPFYMANNMCYSSVGSQPADPSCCYGLPGAPPAPPGYTYGGSAYGPQSALCQQYQYNGAYGQGYGQGYGNCIGQMYMDGKYPVYCTPGSGCSGNYMSTTPLGPEVLCM